MPDKTLLLIATLMDSVRAMQLGDEMRAKELLERADNMLPEVAEHREKIQLASLFG